MTNKIASKILEDLVNRAKSQNLHSSIYPPKDYVGEIILSLGPVKRQLLKDLKSDDISDIRPDSF